MFKNYIYIVDGLIIHSCLERRHSYPRQYVSLVISSSSSPHMNEIGYLYHIVNILYLSVLIQFYIHSFSPFTCMLNLIFAILSPSWFSSPSLHPFLSCSLKMYLPFFHSANPFLTPSSPQPPQSIASIPLQSLLDMLHSRPVHSPPSPLPSFSATLKSNSDLMSCVIFAFRSHA